MEATVEEGMKVDAYRNLNEECISVKSREQEDYGIVVDHADCVLLRDVEFVVREKGRQKVIEEERKNVHAFARGKRIPSEMETRDESWTRVTYNPYEYDSFVVAETEEPIEKADLAFITTEGVFIP